MLKTVIVLPDGTELSSGTGSVNAIQSTSIIECVNSGTELTIGSTCSNSIEVKIFAPNGAFGIKAGTEMEVYREDEHGNRSEVGIFIAETPTRVTANTLKVLGYDRVSKLDKDLTAWLAGLAGWPYYLNTFASMICEACGVPFKASEVPNMDYKIPQFSKSSVTGRQLMKWLGEICCSFCRADAHGYIEFSWYTPAGVQKITPTGDSYYFQNGLSYEDYVVAPVEAVQLRLADSENGALWPPADEGANSYVITGNPILTSNLDKAVLQPILDNILPRLAEDSYTPCKVSIPASMNIHAGNFVQITDKNGKTFATYVMTKTQSGQKDTLESTGSARRDSSSAVNNKTQEEKDAAMEDYANSAANKAVQAQTADEVLRRLTNDYQIQGLWQENGEWYFNAQAVHVLNLVADLITTGKLKSSNGGVYIDLDKGIGNLARGVSATLSGWDDENGIFRPREGVVDEFVVNELKQMQFNTIRDYAVQAFQYAEYGEGVKIAIFKYRRSSAQPAASISFEWADGTRSHKTAKCLSELGGEVWEIEPMEWL